MKKIILTVLTALMCFVLNAQTLFEGFESLTFPPDEWQVVSQDGGTGWERLEAGFKPVPGFEKGVVITAPDLGGIGVAFCSYITGGHSKNDQWLITKQFIPAAGDELSFWIRKFDFFSDALEIKISTLGNAISDFTNNIAVIQYSAPDTGFTFRTYSLANYTGQAVYIAFREKVDDNFTEGAAIFLDNVRVAQPAGANNAGNEIYVSVYPNPVNDFIEINLSVPIANINVLNTHGEIVLFHKADSHSVRLNTHELSSGLYFLIIETATSNITLKICVLK